MCPHFLDIFASFDRPFSKNLPFGCFKKIDQTAYRCSTRSKARGHFTTSRFSRLTNCEIISTFCCATFVFFFSFIIGASKELLLMFIKSESR